MTSRLLALASSALLLLIPSLAAARIPPKRDGVWAQSYVDRLPDPAVRFGTLPNGMRFAILRNATPAGQLAMRLVIKAGSLVETPGNEGVAHFLEHMAFRGSAHVPDGEMMRILQRRGLSFGADTNAGTNPDATVYQFDFPQGGKDNLDTGLMLFREVASELTIAQKDVDAERGAVLSEERLRDGPALRSVRALLDFALPGQLAADRLPIGKVDAVSHADAARIRHFYEIHYRPEVATVIVVGDIDPVEAEAAIKARFGDWRAKAPAAPAPDLGRPKSRGRQVKIFTEPGAPTRAQVIWERPFDDRADTIDRTRDDINRFVAMLILNQRLGDIARRADAPFIGAAIAQSNLLKSANTTNLVVDAGADRQLTAIRAALDEQRRLMRFGITQPELDRALAALNSALGSANNGAATRPSNVLANKMTRDVVDNEVTRSPAQDYADYQAWARFARLKDIEATAKASFEGSGPLLFVSAPQPPAGGEAAVASALDEGARGAIAPPAATQTSGWPYGNFGTPGKVVARREIADLGVTELSFENGVKLLVKPTAFAKGEILVTVGFGQGRLGLPANRAYAHWLVNAQGAFTEGGTGKVPAGEIQRIMSGRQVGVRLETQEIAFQLAGKTRPEDLLVEMQIAAAYLSDPGFRPEAINRVQSVFATMLPQLETTPNMVLARDLGRMLHSGDPRWATLPSAEQLAQTKPQDMIFLMEPALSSALTVTIVGDTTVDQAIAAVAPTLGALPTRPPRVAPSDAGVHFPAPTASPVHLLHNGRADQAIAFAAWPTTDYYRSPEDARALQVVAALVRQRLFDTIREKEGSTYSPDVSVINSSTIANYGFFAATVEMPPAKLAGFYAALDGVMADLRDKAVGADELDRAKKPLIEGRSRDRQLNIYWLSMLATAQYDPREYDGARTRVSGIEKVGAADVQRVARTYLNANRAFRLTVTPREATPAK
jgi:zinc protease